MLTGSYKLRYLEHLVRLYVTGQIVTRNGQTYCLTCCHETVRAHRGQWPRVVLEQLVEQDASLCYDSEQPNQACTLRFVSYRTCKLCCTPLPFRPWHPQERLDKALILFYQRYCRD